MKIIVRFFIVLVSLMLASCSGSEGSSSGGGSNGGGSNGGGGATVSASEVNLGNITTIPLGGSSSNTSMVVTNNSTDLLVLQSATYTLYSGANLSPQPANNSNSPINVSQCSIVAARSTCSIMVKAPITTGQGQYLITMIFKDSKTQKNYKTDQIVAYSDLIPALSTGVAYSNVNSNVYNEAHGNTTLSIPFLLTKNFSSLSASSNLDNPAFVPTISCPANSYTAGSLCTMHVRISRTGTSRVIAGGISVFGDINVGGSNVKTSSNMRLASISKNNNLHAQGSVGFLFNVPITVTQAALGNLIVSGINIVVNPSDGSSGNAQTVTLLNNGNATISGISVTGATPVVISNNGCTSLVAAASCTFKVNVTSSISGQSAVVVNYNNGATNNSVSFNVIYISAVAGPSMTMVSGQGLLTNVPINSNQYASIVVTNTGDTTLSNITFTNPALTSSTFSWDSSSTCATDGSLSLVAGAKCTLVLKFSPTAVISGAITIRQTATYNDQGGNPQTYASASIALSYSSISGDSFVTISPNYVSFGIRADGNDTATQSFTVRNIGLQSTTINTINIPAVTDFASIGGTCVAGTTILAANGESCTIITKYGPTSTAVSNTNAQLTVGYKPNSSYTSNVLAISDLNFNASTAANIAVSNIAVANSTSGTGLSGSPYQFTNSPSANTQITLTVTYTNSGTATASNFNVALNNLPVGFAVNVAGTTCGYGSSVTSLAAASSCTVKFVAMDPLGMYNPYGFSGIINVNIPGYSYTDSNTGLNTVQFPIWSGNYADSNTIYITANLLASVSTTTPSWTTGTAGGTNNYTFTGTPNGTVITIPSGQLSGFTIGGGRTCTIASGTCNISITNPSGFPLNTPVYFSYIVAPTGSSGIIQQATFTYTN